MKIGATVALLGLLLGVSVGAACAQSPKDAVLDQSAVMELMDVSRVVPHSSGNYLRVWSALFSPEKRKAIEHLMPNAEGFKVNDIPVFTLDGVKSRIDIGIVNVICIYKDNVGIPVQIPAEIDRYKFEPNPNEKKESYFSYLANIGQLDSDILEFSRAKTWSELSESGKNRILRSLKTMSGPDAETLRSLLTSRETQSKRIPLVFTSDAFVRASSGTQSGQVRVVRMVP